MKIEYVLSPQEIKAVKDRLAQLRQIALLNRNAYDAEANREYYLRAKGFEEALTMLGIIQEGHK